MLDAIWTEAGDVALDWMKNFDVAGGAVSRRAIVISVSIVLLGALFTALWRAFFLARPPYLIIVLVTILIVLGFEYVWNRKQNPRQ